MKIKTASEEYLQKAKHLAKYKVEGLLSRMGGKLERRLEKDELSKLEALAIQLELEDEQLAEWREKMIAIREEEEKDKACGLGGVKRYGQLGGGIHYSL